MINTAELKASFKSDLAAVYSDAEVALLWRIFYEEYSGLPALQEIRDPEKLEELAVKMNAATRRLLEGEPYQYVLGHVPFAGLDLCVRPGVLIPRPETEELVALIRQENHSDKILSVLDIGTGSGCLALGVAVHFPAASVTAIDISAEALAVALENMQRNRLNVQLERMDVLDSTTWNRLPQFDLILSNPPYISESEKGEMASHVLDHEPDMALFVNNADPLLFYRSIEALARGHLREAGRIYLELNSRFAKETRQLFSEKGWQAELIDDMSGNTRFLKVWK